jgi:hypothetical protein
MIRILFLQAFGDGEELTNATLNAHHTKAGRGLADEFGSPLHQSSIQIRSTEPVHECRIVVNRCHSPLWAFRGQMF